MTDIFGTIDNDTLSGTNGDDLIYGYEGADTIHGNDGNDTLNGGTGADQIFGDAGNDVFNIWGGDDNTGKLLDGGTGINQLNSGGNADLTGITISNIQTLSIDTYGQVRVSASQINSFSNLIAEAGQATIIATTAGAYDLTGKTVTGTFNFFGSDAGNSFIGDASGQSLWGGNGDDVLNGMGGDDTLFGLGGTNTLIGGDGNDVINCGAGSDTMLGGNGDDTFTLYDSYDSSINNTGPQGRIADGGTGNNTIDINSLAYLSNTQITNVQTLHCHGYGYVWLTGVQLGGFSTLIAENIVDNGHAALIATNAGSYDLTGKTVTGSFDFYGSDLGNTFIGDAHAQTLWGGNGNDILNGMDGDDTLIGSSGSDTMLGGNGNDTIKIWGGDNNIGKVINGGTGTNQMIAGGNANLTGTTISNIQTLDVDNYEQVTLLATQFSAFSNLIAESGHGVLIAGGAGAYDLTGKSVTGSFDFYGSDLGNTFIGDTHTQAIYGGNGNDVLNGMGGNDSLIGNDGNDTLIGGVGADQLTGGTGANVFKFTAITDSVWNTVNIDTITDYKLGTDKIDVTGLGFSGMTTGVATAGQLTVIYDTQNVRTIIRDTNGSGFGFYMAGIQLGLTDTNFIGFVPASTGGSTITGTAASNVLQGTAGNDLILGLAGADQLFGNNGDDTLDGGVGVDQMTGGAGADVFRFSAKTDSLSASGMDRIADFVEGTDKIDVTGLGFTGITTGTPTAGQLKLTYDSYYKQTYVKDLGGSGFGFYMSGNHSTLTIANFIGMGAPPPVLNTITGTAGSNALQGTAGNDLITGLAGADQLFGNNGDDTLDGGAGVDQMTGGAGADVFRFSAKTDSLSASGMDRIADFVEGTDKIDVTGLGFTGITTGTPTAGQLKLTYDSYYKQTYVKDLGGSGFGFYMSGNHTALANANFIGFVNAIASFAPASSSTISAQSLQQPQLLEIAAAS
jgi:Ca2+-binding RTX toxin-like protein